MICALCCLAVLTFATAAPNVFAGPSYTKSTRFKIPFEFDTQEIARLRVNEVQLYVSTNNGANWVLAGSAAPGQGFVPFEANGDGEYWFSVKTKSADGTILPRGAHQASLEVIVDTQRPNFELDLSEVEPGRVRLVWNADDVALDLRTMMLEFQDPQSGQWSEVGVRSDRQGQTTWGVETGGEVVVRGRVADLAGNEKSVESRATISPQRNRQESPDFSRPVAGAIPASNSIQEDELPSVVPLRNTSSSANQPQQVPRPAMQSPVGESPANQDVPQSIAGFLQEPQAPPTLPTPVIANATPSIPTPQATRPPAKSVVRQQLINSRHFRLEYNVKSVGHSGVRSVALYITEDGGRKWWFYDNDLDCRSPMEVAVPRDGSFGFAFRVESGAGMVAPPPQPGDLPDLSILVDQVPPQPRLYPLDQPVVGGDQKVNIRWSVPDTDLSERPVALYYANAPSGPWKLIEGRFPNTGNYPWTLPQDTGSDAIFVRIEVRDAAGNMGAHVSDRPLVLDFSHPEVEVIGVQTIRP
ncbi:MAG: hypothetical protein H6824_05230 [Planctomycetaceae bacterium]|nr:hypothetical protein [Planctomycetaceae bacterium]